MGGNQKKSRIVSLRPSASKYEGTQMYNFFIFFIIVQHNARIHQIAKYASNEIYPVRFILLN